MRDTERELNEAARLASEVVSDNLTYGSSERKDRPAAQVRRWTEQDDSGRVWLCWYEPSSDPRESRSWLNRTPIRVPA